MLLVFENLNMLVGYIVPEVTDEMCFYIGVMQCKLCAALCALSGKNAQEQRIKWELEGFRWPQNCQKLSQIELHGRCQSVNAITLLA